MINNNHKIISRLAKKTLHNKIKTIFMLISITLVSYMLYTIFAVGFSYYDNYKLLNTRLQGTTANISLTNPSNKQLKKIDTLEYISLSGTQTYCGDIISDEANKSLVLTNYSTTEWQDHIQPTISDFKGYYPQKENEIGLSKATIEQLGLDNIKLNSTIELMVKHDQTIQKEKFIITAIFQDFVAGISNYSKSANVASEILYYNDLGKTNQDYCNSIVSNAYKQKHPAVFNTVMMSLKNNPKSSQDILKQLTKDLSVGPDQQLMAFGLSDTSSGLEFVLASIFIAIIIIVSGYLLINNIMQISIIRDIQYYGQLKTLGSTPKQIKAIVRKQVFIYGYLAVPIGIILASITSIKIIPYFIKSLSKGSSIEKILPVDCSFNILIFIFVVIFMIITLWLSCLKPAKAASRITPIDALSYNGITTKTAKKTHFHKKNRLFWMAFRNIFSNKKRAILVFCSLFLGLFTFITVYSAFCKPDFTILFNRQQPYSFNVEANNKSFEGISSDITNNDIETVKNMIEVTDVTAVKTVSAKLLASEEVFDLDIKDKQSYYQKDVDYYIKHPEEYLATIIILNDDQVRKFNKIKSNFDYELFNSGNAVILLDTDSSKKNIGKNIYLKDTKNNDISFVVDNLFTYDQTHLNNGENYLISDSDNVCIYMSEQGAKRLTADPVIEELKINTSNNDKVVKEKLSKLFNNRNVIIKSQIDTKESLKPIINSIMFVAISFSLILIILGILNFINVIVTSVTSRQRELSTLEAIGMNKYQLKKLLIYEGTIYVLISLFISFTIGIFISKIVVDIVHQSMYYFVYSLPLYIICILTITLLAICIITTLILSKIITKKPISNRLRL